MKNILSTWLLTIATAAVVHAQSGLGTALSFDGLDDKVEIGAAPVPAPWTAECWLNRQDSFDDSAILLGDAATALKMEQWPNTRRVGFSQFGGADYSFNYISPSGTWVHLAWVGTTNSTALYVNGVLQDTIAATISLPVGQIGADINNRFINRFRGMLDEVRIWNIARSQSEIQANMNHRLTGSEAYLLAYWAFDEGVGTTALDSTGHGLNGALVNGPTWVNSTAALSGIYNWTEWSEIPTNMTTDVTPNCTVYQGRLYLFAKADVNRRIYLNSLDGTNWTGWSEVPGNGTTDAPLGSASFNGNLYLFGKGIDYRGVYVNRFDGTNWTGWGEVPGGGTTDAALNAIKYGAFLYLFRKGNNDTNTYFTRFDGDAWIDWQPMVQPFQTDVAIGSTSFDKVLFLFAKGLSDQRVYASMFDGLTWGEWLAISGSPQTDAPLAATGHGGVLYLFGKAIADRKIYSSSRDGDAWSDWSTAGGLTDVAAAVCDFHSRLFLFRADPGDRRIYFRSGSEDSTTLDCLDLIVTRQAQNVILTWGGVGILQEAPGLNGPWNDVVGARSPFSRSVSAERRLFRVLRFVGSGSGRRQGICATEVSTGYDVKQDPSVTGDWLNLPNVTLWAMPEGDKREEEPFLQHFDWYEATAYRQLAPGQSSSIDVPITEPLILVATTDWYGNGGIINQEISLNGTHLAGGIPMIIDDNRGTVTSQITISQNGTARVTRTNTGTKPITIRPAVGTIRPAELESP